jgi:acyl-ACP thioesterase
MGQPDLTAWYADDYAIYHKDIDARGELRLTALLLMLQETAWNHAFKLGIGYDSKGFENIIWVLSRMRVELLGHGPDWMDTVRLHTSPTGVDKLFAMRDFLALDGRGQAFARASSAWIMIDSVDRRPIRPQSLLDSGNFAFQPPVLPGGTVKLREPAAVEPTGRRRAAWSDVDAHQHVNNVKYAEWCLDAYPRERWEACRLVEYDVNFNAEMSWGQAADTGYAVDKRPADAGADWYLDGKEVAERHTHVIREVEGGKPATLVRLGWSPRGAGGSDA